MLKVTLPIQPRTIASPLCSEVWVFCRCMAAPSCWSRRSGSGFFQEVFEGDGFPVFGLGDSPIEQIDEGFGHARVGLLFDKAENGPARYAVACVSGFFGFLQPLGNVFVLRLKNIKVEDFRVHFCCTSWAKFLDFCAEVAAHRRRD